MKRFAILFAAICMVSLMASESYGQYYRGYRGGGLNRGGFSISIGTGGFYGGGLNAVGFNRGFGGYGGYGAFRPAYGFGGGFGGGGFGYAPVYRRPAFVPVVPVYGGFGGGFGGYGGYRRGCGGW